MSLHANITLTRPLPAQLPKALLEIKRRGEKNKINPQKSVDAKSSKFGTIAKAVIMGAFLAGGYSSIQHRNVQHASALAAMKAGCQKNYEEKLQQCITFQLWCSIRAAPQQTKGFLEAHPEYKKTYGTLATNYGRATAQQEFLNTSPMMACLNYAAFTNTENNGIAKDSGIKLHEDLHPFVGYKKTDIELREHCKQTTANHCPV